MSVGLISPREHLKASPGFSILALSHEKRGSDLVGLNFTEAGMSWSRRSGSLESVDNETVSAQIDGQVIAQNGTTGCNVSARILVTDVGLRFTSGYGDVNRRNLTAGQEIAACLLDYSMVSEITSDVDEGLLVGRGKRRLLNIKATGGGMEIQVKSYSVGGSAKVTRPTDVTPLEKHLVSLLPDEPRIENPSSTPVPDVELSRWATGWLHRVASQEGSHGPGSSAEISIHDRGNGRQFSQLFDQSAVSQARKQMLLDDASDLVGVIFHAEHNHTSVLWIEARDRATGDGKSPRRKSFYIPITRTRNGRIKVAGTTQRADSPPL